jgi:uncharacterized OB-fold protein
MAGDVCPRCGTLRDPADGHCLKCGFDFFTSELVRAALTRTFELDARSRKAGRPGK